MVRTLGRILRVGLAFLVVLGGSVGGAVTHLASQSVPQADQDSQSLYLAFVPQDSRGPFDLPTVQFSRGSYGVVEGGGDVVITVLLGKAWTKTVSIDYWTSDGTAQAGSDYAATSGTLSFPPGSTRQVFTVTVHDDTIDELDETIGLTLGNARGCFLGTPYAATLGIADDDELPAAQFSSGTYSAYEGTGSATIQVTLSNSAEDTITVEYATADGTARAGSDYAAVHGTLRFAPGQTVQSFAVDLYNDGVVEPDETVLLSLSHPNNAILGDPSASVLTILDSGAVPTVQFESASLTTPESAGTLSVAVTLSSASDVPVTVECVTSDGTALSGTDYGAMSSTLSFAPGETRQTCSVPLYDDPFVETNEGFYLDLRQPEQAILGTPSQLFLTVTSEDLVEPSSLGLQIAAPHEIDPGAPVLVQSRAKAQAYDSLIDALADTGADWTRWRIDWNDIEPNEPMPGQAPEYHWEWNDARLRRVREIGVRLLINVADAPLWAADDYCAPIYPDRLDEYARFLTDLVNHYKGPPFYVRHWELLNEPDYDGSRGCEGGYAGWGDYPDRYAEMLAVAYPAIKAADPDATVIMGGLAYDYFDEYGGTVRRYFVDRVMQNGGALYMDALNLHYNQHFHSEWERWTTENPPTCGIVDDGVGTAYDAEGPDVIAKIKHLRNRMAACHSVHKPLWVTELARSGYFYNPDSLDGQARYVMQGNARALAAGAEVIIWFALTSPNEVGQGLLGDDWTPKPAFYTYALVTTELAGHTYHRTMDLLSWQEGYVFRDRLGREKTVIWANGGVGRAVSFAPADRLRVVDREGNVTWIDDGGAGDQDGSRNREIGLLVTIEPVFVSLVD